MVIGSEPYQELCDTYHKPFVITGFEPLDILQAILMLVTQIVEKRCEVENQYKRIVHQHGNELAQQAISEVFRLKASSEWRGLGEIAESGVELTDDYQCFDAEAHFACQPHQVADDPDSRCGDVLIGKCKPAIVHYLLKNVILTMPMVH